VTLEHGSLVISSGWRFFFHSHVTIGAALIDAVTSLFSPSTGTGTSRPVPPTIVDRLLQNQLYWLESFTKRFISFAETNGMLS
jgi:hypothetical protein